MDSIELARPHKGVVFDLADTLLWGEKRHWVHRAQAYRAVGRLPPGLTRDRIFHVVDEIRQSMRQQEHDWPPALYWATVNGLALKALDPGQYSGRSAEDLNQLGWQIRQQVQNLHRKGYFYPVPVGKMLSDLARNRVPYWLGSNHEGAFVYELLDKAYPRLGQWFPDDRRFTPESRHVFIHKPNPEFLIRVCVQIGFAPEEVVYVGNSPSNDAPMVESGAQVILLDKDGHYASRIRSPEFQERYGSAIQDRRLLVLHSVRETTRALVGGYRAT